MNATRLTPAAGRPRAAFGGERRLRRVRDFQRVYDGRRSIAGKFIVIWIAPGEGDAARLGVVASKRTFRRAVDRNRAKRLLREAFRLEFYRLGAKVDLVMVARRRILEGDGYAVRAEFLKLAGVLGLTEELQAECAKR